MIGFKTESKDVTVYICFHLVVSIDLVSFDETPISSKIAQMKISPRFQTQSKNSEYPMQNLLANLSLASETEP